MENRRLQEERRQRGKERMKIKYFCEECQNEDLFEEEEIVYKYQINFGGKFPVWNYICKECEKKDSKGDKSE